MAEPEAIVVQLRGLPGEVVPQTGWWSTPALTGESGRRYFQKDERFPSTKITDYGEVIWNYHSDLQAGGQS